MLGKGELAAIGTSVFWAISAIMFTIAGRRVTSPVVNLTRLVVALVLICFVHLYARGTFFPYETEPWRWGWLALSAVLGLVIGDAALFSAYVRIGPQLSMLVMTLTPVFCAVSAWCCFQESIRPIEMVGIALTIAAIGWVVTEGRQPGMASRRGESDPAKPPNEKRSEFTIGVILALIGALGQTANLIFTKYALVDDYSTLSATEVRIFVSTVCLVGWAAFAGRTPVFVSKLSDLRAMLLIIGGAIVGPILGIWLSYVSIEHTRIGIASTIMATPPLLLIPLGAIFLEDRITFRSIVGTFIAVLGVATLFLS